MPDQDPIQSSPAERSHSPAISSPLATPPRHRPTYARAPSIPTVAVRFSTDSADESDLARAHRHYSSGYGLGILDSRDVTGSGAHTPVPANTPDSTAPFLSPSFSGSTRYSGSLTNSPYADTTDSTSKHLSKHSVASLYPQSETGLLSIRERYDEYEAQHNCTSHERFKQRRLGSCISTTILIIVLLSACLSGLFLVVAFVGPRYGRTVRTRGKITVSTAAFITTLLAKIVELCFCTAVVAFLGQALGRRAFNLERPRGVTLAEMNMRNWIISPGTIVTNWSSVKYAGNTVLGILSLLSALSAMFYTSAATALVQPQLKLPGWTPHVLQGLVKTSFANVQYMHDTCQTPIQTSFDPDYAGPTCIELEHASMAYHNYFGWLSQWSTLVANGNGSSEISERPKGYAVINDNTTVTAPWVEQSNVTALWDKYGILVNNVSMAMPHPGVLQAAVDPLNAAIIMQPGELDGLGNYHVRASVPSPVVHVLCVTTNQTVLQPFIYNLWDNDTALHNVTALNMTTWPTQLAYPDPFLEHTILHDIFGWGANYSSVGKNWPPVFPKLPGDYNTILNVTGSDSTYGRDSIYLLGKGGPLDAYGNPNDDNYALCQLKASLTPFCSTQYNASQAGGTLEAVCEDAASRDPLQYIHSSPEASQGNASISRDWPVVAGEWALSLSMNDGTVQANSSNARLLTQFILTTNWAGAKLNPSLPSLAEALAVLSGCTLISSATDSPFVEFWNYTVPAMTDGQHQSFNASLRAQQYASGGTAPYQNLFFLPLLLVFLLSLIILLSFLLHGDWYTDLAEPANLFSLAVNSPPSTHLAGSCGAGPTDEHYRVSWKLSHAAGHVYMESQEGGAGGAGDESSSSPSSSSHPPTLRKRVSSGYQMLRGPVKRVSSGWTSPRAKRKSSSATFEMVRPRDEHEHDEEEN